MISNLYIHFPFCRRKCSYCALHSRAGATAAARSEHVLRVAREIESSEAVFKTVYFGGGSPALCDLTPLFRVLRPRLAPGCEWTVELHPLDVTEDLLAGLAAGGVNRISMGVQSLENAVLSDMGRGYDVACAARALAAIRRHFDNAGIDLIVGYPGEKMAPDEICSCLASWNLRHCSAYSLILEPKTALAHRQCPIPSDDETLDRLRSLSEGLAALGLKRYEISNYAQPGYECRHNQSVWRGEDYIGLGDGAFGRQGLVRTQVVGTETIRTEVTPEEDAKERAIFALRTQEGLDTTARPDWRSQLAPHVQTGLLTQDGPIYRLTPRGTEVCDTILLDLV